MTRIIFQVFGSHMTALWMNSLTEMDNHELRPCHLRSRIGSFESDLLY